jgi:hypothetical protein
MHVLAEPPTRLASEFSPIPKLKLPVARAVRLFNATFHDPDVISCPLALPSSRFPSPDVIAFPVLYPRQLLYSPVDVKLPEEEPIKLLVGDAPAAYECILNLPTFSTPTNTDVVVGKVMAEALKVVPSNAKSAPSTNSPDAPTYTTRVAVKFPGEIVSPD